MDEKKDSALELSELVDKAQKQKDEFFLGLGLVTKKATVDNLKALMNSAESSHMQFYLKENGEVCRAKKKHEFINMISNNFSEQAFDKIVFSFNFFSIMADPRKRKTLSGIKFTDEQTSCLRKINRIVEQIIGSFIVEADKKGLSGFEIIRAMDTFDFSKNNNFNAYIRQSFNLYNEDAIENSYYKESKNHAIHIPVSSRKKFGQILNELKSFLGVNSHDDLDLQKLGKKIFEDIYGEKAHEMYETFLSVLNASHCPSVQAMEFAGEMSGNFNEGYLEKQYFTEDFEKEMHLEIDFNSSGNNKSIIEEIKSIENMIDPDILPYIYASEDGRLDLNKMSSELNSSSQNLNIKLSRLVKKIVAKEKA